MSTAPSQKIAKRTKPGSKDHGGQRTESSAGNKDDETNLQKSTTEATEKKNQGLLDKLGYGWLCDPHSDSNSHCNDEDEEVIDDPCDGLDCSRKRTSACLRVLIFFPGQEDLLPTLRAGHHPHGTNDDTGWYHIDCRTFRVDYNSTKFCFKCNKTVNLGEFAYFCCAY